MTWTTWFFALLAGMLYYRQSPLWVWIILLLILIFLPFLVKLIFGASKKFSSLQALYSAQFPKIISVQVLSNLLCFVQYWLILNCFSAINFWQSWIRMALTQFSNTIPITISGLGLREGFAIHFLAGAGFSPEQAVSVSLTLFFIHDVFTGVNRYILSLKSKKKFRKLKVAVLVNYFPKRLRRLRGFIWLRNNTPMKEEVFTELFSLKLIYFSGDCNSLL